MASIFTKIIRGEIPSYKIHECEHTFSFLDINPIHPGHALVVPKVEVDCFIDVPEPYYSAVFRTSKLVARAIRDATGCKRVGTIILGWDVPHFHHHVVPMWGHGDLDFRKAKKIPAEQMREMQEKIVAEMATYINRS
ncbi:MAG: HIT family protein [Bdellovibrionales bacterium]|nr:HIT family protein [Bdellovibrionales bacterium]